jgi:hypothetical protein
MTGIAETNEIVNMVCVGMKLVCNAGKGFAGHDVMNGQQSTKDRETNITQITSVLISFLGLSAQSNPFFIQVEILMRGVIDALRLAVCKITRIVAELNIIANLIWQSLMNFATLRTSNRHTGFDWLWRGFLSLDDFGFGIARSAAILLCIRYRMYLKLLAAYRTSASFTGWTNSYSISVWHKFLITRRAALNSRLVYFWFVASCITTRFRAIVMSDLSAPEGLATNKTTWVFA